MGTRGSPAVERLRDWLESTGHKHVELVEALGIDKARVCRFLKGKAALATLDQYRKIEEFTGGAIKADDLAAEAPPTGARHRAAKPSAPAAPEPAPVPSPNLADDVLSRMAEALAPDHPEVRPLIAIELRLAASARAESVRQRAAADLLDRICGKATQRVVDATPRPPVEAPELIDLFASILKPAPVVALPVPQVPGGKRHA